MVNQCLFNWVDFYSKKGHKYIPGIIIFPQYFAFTIISILKNVKLSQDFQTLCQSYIEALQYIINCIFDTQDLIKININELKKLLTDPFSIPVQNILLLETYLLNEESINCYRNKLLNTTLQHYDQPNLTEYIQHLFRKHSCQSTETITSFPPSSVHYLLFGDLFAFENEKDNTYKNNSTVNYKDISPEVWGPFYWNVMHHLSENTHKLYNCTEKIVKKRIISCVYSLPVTIPCMNCSNNYFTKISTIDSLINTYKQDNNVVHLFHEIHSHVTQGIYLPPNKTQS